MIRSDINMLSARERQLLDASFQPGHRRRRMRAIALSSGIFLLGLWAFGELGLTTPWFAAVACMVLLVSAIEKVTYQTEMNAYESLICKLVNRIEVLEGVPPTHEEGIPSESARPSSPRLGRLAG